MPASADAMFNSSLAAASSGPEGEVYGNQSSSSGGMNDDSKLRKFNEVIGKRFSVDQPRLKGVGKFASFNLHSIQESLNKQLSNFTHLGSKNSPETASTYADLQLSILQLQE